MRQPTPGAVSLPLRGSPPVWLGGLGCLCRFMSVLEANHKVPAIAAEIYSVAQDAYALEAALIGRGDFPPVTGVGNGFANVH